MSFIQCYNVSKNFGKTPVLFDVDFSLEAGQQCAITGPSGSGKSTLLHLLGGLDQPHEGEIIVDGINLLSCDDQKLAQYRNKSVGFVFQFHFLLSSMNCWDNIFLPCRISGQSTNSVRQSVEQLIEHLEIGDCMDKFPYQLSGGEQQRVNIVRALSLRPKILLCDEPTGNLDSENSHKVIELLKQTAELSQATLIVVTHNIQIAQSLPLGFLMCDGRIQKK